MLKRVLGCGALVVLILSGCAALPPDPFITDCMSNGASRDDCLAAQKRIRAFKRAQEPLERQREIAQRAADKVSAAEYGWVSDDYDRWAVKHPREARAAHLRQLVRQGPPGGYGWPARSWRTPRYSRGYGYGYATGSRPAYGYGR